MRSATVLTSAAGLPASLVVVAALVAGVQAQAPISLLPAGEPGTPLQVDGRILGPGGPIANAALYVYQTDATGIYSNAERDDNTKPRLKARFATDAQGRFAFSTIVPGQYPRSGPPAHIHVEVTPPGRSMQQYEVVFEGDSRLTDSIRADAKAGKFYFLCTLSTGAAGSKKCTDVTFRLP
jgi:protocatechuate 3,4-dioxygenase beta subunit